MCNRIQQLANVGQFRWVAICEHGNVRLSWDNTIIFLDPSTLKKLGYVLDLAIVEAANSKTLLPDAQQAQLEQTEGYFNIWIGRHAIQLKPVDYLVFGSLISQSLNSLNPQAKLPRCKTPISVEAKVKTVSDQFVEPSLCFSKN